MGVEEMENDEIEAQYEEDVYEFTRAMLTSPCRRDSKSCCSENCDYFFYGFIERIGQGKPYKTYPECLF